MKIEKLIIKNFKNYIGEVTFDLSKQVILLYGANGFGKSSFFDAIEWCLTGKINRFNGLENDLKYDIANKRINNEDSSFEVSVTLSFDGNTLTRYFTINNGGAGNLQVRIKSSDGKTHIGQEQVEAFLKSTTAASITYERGSFSQLLKQAFILSQEQVTDFITNEDAKERYKALANIMGLKSTLIEFDNFKRVLKGIEKKKDGLVAKVKELEKSITDKSETMHNFEEDIFLGLLNKHKLSPLDKNIKYNIDNIIDKKLSMRNSYINYMEYYKVLDAQQSTKSINEIKRNLKNHEIDKEILLSQKVKAENLKETLDNKLKGLFNIKENFQKINELKANVSNLKNSLKKLNINEKNIKELNDSLELLREKKILLEYNLEIVKFEKNNDSIITNKNNINNIKNKIEKLNNRHIKNKQISMKVNKIIEINKDQVLARLISGVRDIQSYTDKFLLDTCPICSSPKDNLSNQIALNLDGYVKQLNEESSYYEKIIKLSKLLKNREQKLSEEIISLTRILDKSNNEIKGFENDLAIYKSSDLFNKKLFSLNPLVLEEKLAKKINDINLRQEAVELTLKIEKILSDISGYEKTSKMSLRIENINDLEGIIKKYTARRAHVNNIYIRIVEKINIKNNEILKINQIINKLEDLINLNQFNISISNLNNIAKESVNKIEDEVAELNLVKDLLIIKEMNSSIKKQIQSIKEEQISLNFKESKLNSYVAKLEKYRGEKQNYIGNGIADFLNRNHSTVQRYFRYLDPIPSNCDLIFEGNEDQLNIKVAFNKDFCDKPGGKSNAKNILSSGQLNVLAISIFLAINEEQQIHSLNFVGIDDPIQNMDDINQYTMCDVLNNIEKQLIISTHDINFLKLFIKKNEHRKDEIVVYNLKSPYISTNKLERIVL